MNSAPIPRIVVSVSEQPDGMFLASAVLPSGATVDILRKDREQAVRECGEKVRELCTDPVTVVLPFCQPDWCLPYWKLPAFRAYDPDRPDSDDAPVMRAAVRESDDGPVAILITEMMGEDGSP